MNERVLTLEELATATERYALRIVTSSLAPQFEAGDVIAVDPNQTPAVAGEPVVIYLRAAGDAVDAKVAILDSAVPGGPVLARQWRPLRMLCYAASEVLAVHRVIEVSAVGHEGAVPAEPAASSLKA